MITIPPGGVINLGGLLICRALDERISWYIRTFEPEGPAEGPRARRGMGGPPGNLEQQVINPIAQNK